MGQGQQPAAELEQLLMVRPQGGDEFLGSGYGPPDKRAFGGQFLAQALRAAAATVGPEAGPTSLHMQFLRGGTNATTGYLVERTYDGRTAMTRRVSASQDGRLNAVATVSFATPLPGPEHPRALRDVPDPGAMTVTAPPGPAPGLPLHAFDLRYAEHADGEQFVREFYWRTVTPMANDPILHYCIAAYLSDLYLLDTALRVHGHAMTDRTYRAGTTDAAIWFHAPIRADEWNLLQSRSPAASRGRALVTATLYRRDGRPAATLVQEGLVAARE